MRRHVLALALLLFSASSFAKPAPQFQAELLGGKRTSLKQNLKSGRSLILCFWATWCVPCLQELKEVSSRIKENPSLPLDMLSINVDTSETASDVGPTMKLQGFTFPVVLDPKHDIFSKYQAAKSLPFSALVSPSGEIEKTFSGYDEKMFDEIKKHLPTPVSSSDIKL